jgi:putative DNA primase/helicase
MSAATSGSGEKRQRQANGTYARHSRRNDKPRTPLAETIIAARKALGWTQRQLGDAVGRSSGAVAQWEIGKTVPEASHVADLAKILNVHPSKLIPGTGEPAPEAGSAPHPEAPQSGPNGSGQHEPMSSPAAQKLISKLYKSPSPEPPAGNGSGPAPGTGAGAPPPPLPPEPPPGPDPEPEPEPLPQADPDDPRPIIRCAAGKVDILADLAEQALLDANKDVFTRASRLLRPGYSEVEAADGGTTKAVGLYPIEGAALIEELNRAALWVRFDKRSKEWLCIDPPGLVARVLADRKGQWKLRSIAGVITCPTLRPDGSVLSEPGYDPATRLYLMPDPTLQLPDIPPKPTRIQAEAALKFLSDLLTEFPFKTDAHKAVALSLLVTAVVRGALGVVPVHGFTAPTPGTGKSYLADVATAITSGRRCPVITPGKTEEELEKRLGAMLLAGFQTISLDNISSELGGDCLCQAAERPIIRIRILCTSETPECEFRGLLIANGNNLVIAGDMTRRVLLSELDAGIERPEDREFKGNPVKQIMQNRGAYVAAAITIVRAYLEAGQPGKLKPLASYEAWSDMVRSCLVWLGCADPVLTIEEVRAADPVLSTLRTILDAWRAVFGSQELTAQHIAATFAAGFDPNGRGGDDLAALRAALVPVASIRGIIDSVRLGKWLGSIKNRPVDGRKFHGKKGAGGNMKWSVVDAYVDA